jgi:hypothetical protein
MARWRGWLRHIARDQWALWAPACVIGMALPAMFSYEFLRGVSNIQGHAAAAMSAEAIATRHGPAFWHLTLLCGFLIMAPTQVSQLDSLSRRWTDVLWTGWGRLRTLPGNRVKWVYYTILALYGAWGLVALRLTPNPLALAVASGVLMNFALAFSALHTLYALLTLLPPPLRPGWTLRIGLASCSAFYMTISGIAFHQNWPHIRRFLFPQ